jgi:hypothetical protein
MRNTPGLLVILLALDAGAQFAPPGAQWTYDQEGGIYTMTVVGDTVLNGHACSIIEGSSPSICWQSQAYTYQSGDTVFWSDDQYLPQFFELYRWNAQPGESWDVWSNGAVTVTYAVLSTGTTTVNGQTLRTLNVSATDTQMQWAQSSGVLVEHIGDTLFLFPWLAAFCDAMVPWPLRCYTDADLGTFMRPGVTACGPGVGITEQGSASIRLAPTLVAANEPVRWTGDAQLLDVIDAAGRKLRADRSGDERSFTLDRAGSFVVRMRDAEGRPLFQRIVVY